MYGFKKRIEALEIAVKNRKAELRRHDPFILFRPWCIQLEKNCPFLSLESLQML